MPGLYGEDVLRRPAPPALARLAAAVLALSLSGAPAVASLHAPPERHRCTCRSTPGAPHRCACGQCERAALDGEHRVRHASGPCVEGNCAPPGGGAPAVAGVDPFFLPKPPAFAARLFSARVEVSLALLEGRVPAPEPRPPIPAT